jgi:hypothetical protein
MKVIVNKENKTGRREFITRLSAVAALGLAGETGFGVAPAAGRGIPLEGIASMPKIKLGSHSVSRLICGCNPMLGYSYMGPHTDRQMKEYFTTEKTVEFLLKCEQAGITLHQGSSRHDYFDMLRDKGSQLKIISLDSGREKINDTIRAARPIGVVHHGGVTDRLFAEGKSSEVHDYVKAVKDNGIMAGVSAHNPDVIKQIADAGWEVDFFMTCFYFLTRHFTEKEPESVLPVGSYNFYRDDPLAMTKVIRQVEQPCLAFKILGAGRMCSDEEKVRAAFKFAFDNIKPTDGLIVGMFPWIFDEVSANARYAVEYGT